MVCSTVWCRLCCRPFFLFMDIFVWFILHWVGWHWVSKENRGLILFSFSHSSVRKANMAAGGSTKWWSAPYWHDNVSKCLIWDLWYRSSPFQSLSVWLYHYICLSKILLWLRTLSWKLNAWGAKVQVLFKMCPNPPFPVGNTGVMLYPHLCT